MRFAVAILLCSTLSQSAGLGLGAFVSRPSTSPRGSQQHGVVCSRRMAERPCRWANPLTPPCQGLPREGRAVAMVGAQGCQGRDLGEEWEVLTGVLKSKGALIRPAALGDLETVVQLSANFRKEMNPKAFDTMVQGRGMDWMRSEISEVLQMNDYRPSHLLVVCDKKGTGRIIGYIYSTVEEWFGLESLYIAELFVEKKSRGRGFGGILTAGSLNLAHVYGIKCSHLCVGERQQVAGRMYVETFGFAPLKGMETDMRDLELRDVHMGVHKYFEKMIAKYTS